MVLFGTEYWGGLLDWMRKRLALEGMVSDTDLALVQVVDTTDEVCEVFVNLHAAHGGRGRPAMTKRGPNARSNRRGTGS